MPLTCSLIVASLLGPGRALRKAGKRQNPGPGDVGGVPDIEDLLKGAGQDQADEDAQAAAEQFASTGYGAAGTGTGELASAGLKSLEGSVEAAVKNIGRSSITDALAKAQTPPGGGVSGNVPESAGNMEGYMAPMATPPPAPLAGVFCRGGACRYRREAKQQITLPDGTRVPVAVLTSTLPPREFCRGLGCDPEAGFPGATTMNTFQKGCVNMFDKIGGGLKGALADRTVMDVKDSFMALCPGRVHPEEADLYCPSYSDVFVGATSAELNEATVGDAKQICTHVYEFIWGAKRAAVDLKLFVGAFRQASQQKRVPRGKPEEPRKLGSGTRTSAQEQLLLARVAARGDTEGGVGPQSPRGRLWRTWLAERRRGPPVPPEPAGVVHGLAQEVHGDACQDPPSGASPDGDSEAYDYNPPCKQAYSNASQSQIGYEIQPGTADGVMLPIEVPGDLFNFCTDQVREITGGTIRTAPVTVMMTRDWCSWRSTLGGEEGRPEWTGPICTSMAELVTFALRDRLEQPGGIQAPEVCKSLFLATGVIRRVEQIVDGAWTRDLRGVGIQPPVPPPAGDPAMQELMDLVTTQNEDAQKKLEMQRKAEEAVEKAKAAVAGYENGASAAIGAVTEGLGLPGLS